MDVDTQPTSVLGKRNFGSGSQDNINDDRSGKKCKQTKECPTLLERAGCSKTCSENSAVEFRVGNHWRFCRTLEEALICNATARSEFLDNLKESFSDDKTLEAALKPMENDRGGFMYGDSLVRLLMKVTSIQNAVCVYLLEKLAEYFDGDDDRVPRMILGQLRWPDNFLDRDNIAEKMLEVMPLCRTDIKRDLVSLVSMLVAENDYPQVIELFTELLGQDVNFAVSVSQAINEMPLTEELQTEATAILLDAMHGIPVEDFPMLVSCLLEDATEANARNMLEELRTTLNFVTPGDPRLVAADKQGKGKASVKAQSPESETLEAFHSLLRCQNKLCKHTLDIIQSVQDPRHNKTFDFWMLLVLHSLPEYEKQAFTSLAKKLGNEDVSLEKWIGTAIRGHSATLKGLVETVISIAGECLVSKNGNVRAAGSLMYILVFSEFPRAHVRQDVLFALLGHIGSGVVSETSEGLNVLEKIAEWDANELRNFGGILGNLLEMLDRFTDDQLHILFTVFCAVCGEEVYRTGENSGGSGSRLGNQVTITMQKCLDSSSKKDKKIGIIAMLASVQFLSNQVGGGVGGEEAREMSLNRIKDKIEAWQEHAQSDSLGFLFEKLANLASAGMHSDMMKELDNVVQDMFLSTCVEDLNWENGASGLTSPAVELCGFGSFDSELWFNLDGQASSICIQLCSLLASVERSERGSILWCCPCFRLMGALERSQNESLSEIDALLGCPLKMFPMSWLDEDIRVMPASQQKLIVHSLFYATSWLREVVTMFARDVTPPVAPSSPLYDLSGKVMFRMAQLRQLDGVLVEVLGRIPPSCSLPNVWQFFDVIRPEKKVSMGPPPPKSGRAAANKRINRKRSKDMAFNVALPARHNMPVFPNSLASALSINHSKIAPKFKFLGAMYLLSDMSAQLNDTLNATKRPDSNSASSMALQWMHQSVHIGKLLEACCGALKSIKDGNELGCVANEDDSVVLCESSAAQLPPFTPPEDLAMTGHACGEAVVALLPNCQGLLCKCLEYMAMVISHPEFQEGYRLPELCAVLRGFLGKVDSGNGCSVGDAVDLGLDLAKHLEALLDENNEKLEVHLSVVDVMNCILTTLGGHTKSLVGAQVQMVRPKMKEIRNMVGMSAGIALQYSGDANSSQGVSPIRPWKGRAAEISDLLHIRISCNEDPIGQLQTLMEEHLLKLGNEPGDQQLYPSLSTQTLATWYKGIFKELTAVWSVLCIQIEKEHKQQMVPAGMVKGFLESSASCVEVFNGLVQMTKKYHMDVTIQIVALGQCGEFLRLFFKVLPFWQKVYNAHKEPFLLMIKGIQKATKVAQILCSEAKSHKNAAMTGKVPRVKQSLEKFVCKMQSFFSDVEKPGIFWMGVLKHKNLMGDILPSQLTDSQEDNEDGDVTEDENERDEN